MERENQMVFCVCDSEVSALGMNYVIYSFFVAHYATGKAKRSLLEEANLDVHEREFL